MRNDARSAKVALWVNGVIQPIYFKIWRNRCAPRVIAHICVNGVYLRVWTTCARVVHLSLDLPFLVFGSF